MRDQEPVIRSSVFDGIEQFVAREGLAIDVAALMTAHGLDPALTKSSDLYVPLDPVSRVLERAAILSGRPCFGLEYASHYRIGASGSLGYVITNSPTMQEAIDNLIRYIHAFTSPMHIEFRAEPGGVGYIEWTFALEFTAAMPQYVSFALGAVIERLRRIAGPDWTPLQVELIHRELPCPEIYRGVFGSRVRFDAAHNRMWLDPTTLAKRHDQQDELLYRTARIAAEAELKVYADRRQQSGRFSIKKRVRDYLSTVLATGGPFELDQTAAALGLEPRPLQYALEQADTSFSEELSETRRMIAEHLLTATDQSMTEIAAAVGFSELSSFTRACRELWFGMSPSKFRARVRAEGAAPPRPGPAEVPVTPPAKPPAEDWSERD
jgi:AraC-like DNA-binding protein